MVNQAYIKYEHKMIVSVSYYESNKVPCGGMNQLFLTRVLFTKQHWLPLSALHIKLISKKLKFLVKFGAMSECLSKMF